MRSSSPVADEVKALVDGKSAPLQVDRNPKAGAIQSGGISDGLRIVAIEYRELPK